MLDPKYEDLPGIERNKPDFYEWDGGDSVWKKHQDDDSCQDSSGFVNTLPALSIKQALAKFNGYDLTDDGCKKETPEEKLERIRREIKELELENVSGSETLQADLSMALRKTNDVPKAQDSKPQDTDTASLEHRISQLERALGPDAITDSQTTDLFKRCDKVSQKLDLLDPENLAFLEQKMAAVQVKMDRISKGTMSDDQIGKMDEMERLVVKLSTQVPIIPILIDRLETLKFSHERAAEALSHNIDQAGQLEQSRSSISGLEESLKNLEHIVKYNTDVITTNLGVLEARLNKLS